MSEKIYGVGIVGYGFMGKTHTFGYHTIPFFYKELPIKYALKGVCVRRPETLVAVVNEGKFEFGTTDFQELLDRADIDIIHVCTPNHLHRDQVVRAAEAGKHIYCDKPLGSSYAECQDMVAAVENCSPDIVTQVALQYRFYPCTMRAKELMEEGFLGKIYSFRASYLHASSADPNKPLKWKLDKKKGGGGVLYDLGSHVLDLVNFLVGGTSRIFCETHTAVAERKHPETGELTKVETDDLALMLIRTNDGALGSVEATKIATGTNDELRVEIHGELGALRFNLMDPNWLEVFDARDKGGALGGDRGFKRIETVSRYPEPGGLFPAPACNIGWLRAHVACLHNFLLAVGGKGEAHLTIPGAAELQRQLDSAYTSAETGTWQ
jgi:predicted dehydrogenase